MEKFTRKPVSRLKVITESRTTGDLVTNEPRIRSADGFLKINMILRIIQNPRTMFISDPNSDSDAVTVPSGLVVEVLRSYIRKTRRLKARDRRIANLEERCRSLEEENKALKAGNADLSETISSIRREGVQKATKARAINSARTRDALDRVVQAPGLFD